MSEKQIRTGSNLLITNLCNRSCPYCFLKDWITSDPSKAQYMSLDNLDVIINWAKKLGYPASVQLLGGEPTLHPDIIEIVKKLQASDVEIETILTNGLGDTEVYASIKAISKAGWLVNVDSPQSYTKDEWKLLNRNLELLRWNGRNDMKENGFDSTVFKLQLAITFYKPKQDYSYVIDLARKYGCTHIRGDPSHPGKGKCNKYVDFEHLAGLKPTLLNFFKDCVREGIKPSVEDALPPCIFTQRELAYVSLFVNRFHSVCFPNPDVFPNLMVEHCASMRGILPAYSIREYRFDEILNQHVHNSESFKSLTLPRCRGCMFFMKRQCQGYCLQYKNDFLEENSDARMEQVISSIH